MTEAMQTTRAQVPQGQRTQPPKTPMNIDTSSKLMAQVAEAYGMKLEFGEVMMLGPKVYVTKGGLLRTAHKQGVKSMIAIPMLEMSDPANGAWVFKATVITADGGEFIEYGQASQTDKNPVARQNPFEMASTRAMNRAIRLACSVGFASIEELAEAQWDKMKRADILGADQEPTERATLRPALSPPPHAKTEAVQQFEAQVEAESKGTWADPEPTETQEALAGSSPQADLAGL